MVDGVINLNCGSRYFPYSQYVSTVCVYESILYCSQVYGDVTIESHLHNRDILTGIVEHVDDSAIYGGMAPFSIVYDISMTRAPEHDDLKIHKKCTKKIYILL